MDYATFVDNYKYSTRDFETDPYEMLHALQVRSTLKYHIEYMNEKEVKQLNEADECLFKNAEKVVEHLKTIYDFEKSQEAKDEWWWHLADVLSGKIEFKKVKNS